MLLKILLIKETFKFRFEIFAVTFMHFSKRFFYRTHVFSAKRKHLRIFVKNMSEKRCFRRTKETQQNKKLNASLV